MLPDNPKKPSRDVDPPAAASGSNVAVTVPGSARTEFVQAQELTHRRKYDPMSLTERYGAELTEDGGNENLKEVVFDWFKAHLSMHCAPCCCR